MPGTGTGETEAQRGSDIMASWSSERHRQKEAEVINRVWGVQGAALLNPGSEKVPDGERMWGYPGWRMRTFKGNLFHVKRTRGNFTQAPARVWSPSLRHFKCREEGDMVQSCQDKQETWMQDLLLGRNTDCLIMPGVGSLSSSVRVLLSYSQCGGKQGYWLTRTTWPQWVKTIHLPSWHLLSRVLVPSSLHREFHGEIPCCGWKFGINLAVQQTENH